MESRTSGPGTIVVAVDGSPASVAAIRYARHLGRELRLRLIAVTATVVVIPSPARTSVDSAAESARTEAVPA